MRGGSLTTSVSLAVRVGALVSLGLASPLAAQSASGHSACSDLPCLATDDEAPFLQVRSGPLGERPASAVPNVVLLVSDQHRADWTPYDIPELQMPTFMRVATQGTRFTQAICPSPLCAPSRVALATGMNYGRKGTAFDNRNSISEESTTFYKLLRDAGVWTMTAGKDDLDVFGPDGKWHADQLGFRRFMRSKGKNEAAKYHPLSDNYTTFLNASGWWQSYQDTMYNSCTWSQYGCPEPFEFPQDLYVDDYTGSWAVKLLNEVPEGQPFFLQVNYPGPHPPFIITEEMNASLPDGRSWPRAVNSQKLDADVQQQIRAHYASEIENIDRLNGRILGALEASGRLGSTVVCLLSDHGEALGDHWDTAQLFEPLGKESPYQGSVHVPLACMGPGIPAGRDVHAPIGTLDLAATVLEMQGVAVPAGMDARSQRSVLLGAEPEDRPVSSSLATPDGLRHFSAVLRRLGDHVYKLMCCRAACPEGAALWEASDPPSGGAMVRKLFDLTEDPLELHDKSSDRPDVVEQMAEMLPDVFRGCRALDDEELNAYQARMHVEDRRTMEEVAEWKSSETGAKPEEHVA